MSTTIWILVAIAVAIVILAIVTWVVVSRSRTERLRARFGPEYGRELEKTHDQRQVEGSLKDHWKRVERLHIRPLLPNDRARFVASWGRIQERFIDDPGVAVMDADRLLADVMSARGYPADYADFEQRAADISVDHPFVVEDYRTAHSVAALQARGKASTEELRQAMIHYRSLLEELVGDQRGDVITRIAS